MARIANFTSAGTPTDPTGGMTLDALMLRQKMLAEQGQRIAAPRNMQSPWQGAAMLGETLANSLQAGRTENQMAAGRDELAKIRAGINLDTGPTSEQIGQVSRLDPGYADNLTQLAVEAIRSKRQREQQLADVQTGYAHEGAVDTRELGQAQAATAAATATEQAQHARDLSEKKVTTITGDDAKARNLDPRRTWEVNPTTGEAKDITPTVPDTYREPTADERVKYGLIEGQPYKMKVTQNGTVEPISIGAGMTPMPAEVAARVGLGDEFLSNYDNILASAQRGEMTGPIDYATSVLAGRGPGGTAYRQLMQGSESILRQMSGAGLNTSEIAGKIKQYEPSPLDDAATLVDKLKGLHDTVVRLRASTTLGHKVPDQPGAGGDAGVLPNGATEDDIAETMRANSMTRQQVLDALAKTGGNNGGP